MFFMNNSALSSLSICNLDFLIGLKSHMSFNKPRMYLLSALERSMAV
ncbi:hypothetical protein A359_05620 [secondary endosymbiont of Ctenarytaina eucalypti]|uniref:Uncharacterized protein n=1 Tax=secondary endosymbiont of Ctenarytaina eucalypti TaxID=1199245 RepID=J3Z3Y4_9ENTR|nr:hypothetical protein A359_05620 [secondary endosymbiont of Ctenarytaina eucalypti]